LVPVVTEDFGEKISLTSYGSLKLTSEWQQKCLNEEARYITGQVLNVDGGMAGAWV